MGNGVDVDPDEGVVRATRTVRKSGGSLVVSFPREVLQVAGLDEGDDVLLEAEWDGDAIHIRGIEPDEDGEDGED